MLLQCDAELLALLHFSILVVTTVPFGIFHMIIDCAVRLWLMLMLYSGACVRPCSFGTAVIVLIVCEKSLNVHCFVQEMLQADTCNLHLALCVRMYAYATSACSCWQQQLQVTLFWTSPPFRLHFKSWLRCAHLYASSMQLSSCRVYH